jgi:hypothetical protein
MVSFVVLYDFTVDDNCLYSFGSGRIEKTISSISFIVTCLSVVAETCLSSRHQAVTVFVIHVKTYPSLCSAV